MNNGEPFVISSVTPAHDARQSRPTRIAFGDGLLLRSVQSQADAERYATFNHEIVSAVQGETCAQLLAHHPTMRWDDFFFVEDEATGAVVSTTCLMPWRCRMGSVELAVAMLEMVATHPGYRNRGLVRKQIEHFHHCAEDQGFDLCIIEGIPSYYRQFGYAYATDHWGSDTLSIARIPVQEADPTLRLRPATVVDLPLLEAFYDQAMQQLAAWTARSQAYWRYLIQIAAYPVLMLEDATSGLALGYVIAWRNEPSGMRVIESGIPNAKSALAFLQWCKTQTKGEISIGWPATSTLIQVARSLGSTILPADQWLLRAVDLPRLLYKLAPVWEERLAASPAANLSAELTLNLFRSAYVLHFVNGKLIAVEALGFVDASMGSDGGDLCIAPDAFMRLLFGYRTLDELADAWPDIVVRPASRHLWQLLWPKQATYFWKPYLACNAVKRIVPDEPSESA
jgi:predicted acetyltransferase